jgi:hypothetical protein
MQSRKGEISECIQRLCKIYFRFSGTVIPFCQGLGFLAASYKSAGLLLLYCCCIAAVLLFYCCFPLADSNNAATKQQYNKNLVALQ